MQYFKVNNKTVIEYDDTTQRTRVIDVDSLKEEISKAKDRLQSIPEPVSNAELLAWAKQNYPQTDYSAEIASLKKIRDDNKAIVDLIKTL